MHRFTNTQLADMHLANETRRIYAEKHPERHIPCHVIFKIGSANSRLVYNNLKINYIIFYISVLFRNYGKLTQYLP